MKLFILCVRDRAADVFGTPSFHTSIGAAVRAFTDEINRDHPDNVMFRHPGDFDLYEIGIYDDSKAEFDTHAPSQVAIGKDSIKQVSKDSSRA